MPVNRSRLVPLALAALLTVSAVFVGLSFAPTATAAQCTPPAQKTTYGCCSCNVKKAIYWHCNEAGNWVQSGSACLYGHCCAYPCCV